MNGTTVVSALSVQFGCCFVIAKYAYIVGKNKLIYTCCKTG
jgi:hypothetical protein